MRSVAICFSRLQVPRGRIHSLANFRWESFHNVSRSRVNNSSFKPLASSYGIKGGYSRRWTRRPMTTKTDGRNKANQAATPSNLVRKILDENVSRSTSLNLNKTEEIRENPQLPYCGIQQMIAENKDIGNLVTFIIYDTETSGLSRKDDRIIEIALQDLSGGENSTFQTFLINEFSHCSYEIPSNWLFMDTLPLARELMKSGGSSLPPGTSLQALREHYKIPLVGSAHRAMSDVRTLAMILQMLTLELKLSLSNLVTRSFTALQYVNRKKKS